MSDEKNLFGDATERSDFEEMARKRRGVEETTTDALTPTTVALILTPSLFGTTFIG